MQTQRLRNLNKIKLPTRLRTKEVIKEERSEKDLEDRIKDNTRKETCRDTNLEEDHKELHLPREISSIMVVSITKAETINNNRAIGLKTTNKETIQSNIKRSEV